MEREKSIEEICLEEVVARLQEQNLQLRQENHVLFQSLTNERRAHEESIDWFANQLADAARTYENSYFGKKEGQFEKAVDKLEKLIKSRIELSDRILP